MTVGRIGLKSVRINEKLRGNAEEKGQKLLRKTIPTDLLNLQVEKENQSIVTDNDRCEQLGLYGNTGMLWDKSGTEDGSESSGRLLVGTGKCGGESAACNWKSCDRRVLPVIGNVGIAGKVRMIVGGYWWELSQLVCRKVGVCCIMVARKKKT